MMIMAPLNERTYARYIDALAGDYQPPRKRNSKDNTPISDDIIDSFAKILAETLKNKGREKACYF